MLAVPGFDTYGILPRYARNPRRSENVIALALLKRRAGRQLVWDAFSAYKPGLDLQALLNIRIGMRQEEESKDKHGYVASLLAKPVETKEEEKKRDEIYFELLKRSGVDIEEVRARLQQKREK